MQLDPTPWLTQLFRSSRCVGIRKPQGILVLHHFFQLVGVHLGLHPSPSFQLTGAPSFPHPLIPKEPPRHHGIRALGKAPETSHMLGEALEDEVVLFPVRQQLVVVG